MASTRTGDETTMDGDGVAGAWLVKVAASLFPSVAKDRSQLPLSNRK